MYVFTAALVFFLILLASIHSLDVKVRSFRSPPKVTLHELKTANIKCVLSDMDGTLLGPSHEISDRSILAVKRLNEIKIPFFPATGRSRMSMVKAVGKKFVDIFGQDPAKIPGVFCQGLMVYGENGKLIHNRYLESSVIELCENYCEESGLSLIAIANDDILTSKHSPFTLALETYNEPIPTLIDDRASRKQSKGDVLVNKVIFLGDEDKLVLHRPVLEKYLLGLASVTKAVPGMLEVLPYGSSKGEGVQHLLAHYGLDPAQCLAFGDGENDIEMLSLVKYGIAMSNGRERLLDCAYRTTSSNAEDGVAEVLEQLHLHHAPLVPL